MADPRIIDVNLIATMWQMSSAQYLTLYDQEIVYDAVTEKVVNYNLTGKSSQFFNSASNPEFIPNPDGTTTIIHTQQWTISIATGFTLRGIVLGSSFLTSNQQGYANIPAGVEIFDNETIIIRLRFINKIRKTDITYATMAYNQAGDTVDIGMIPWGRPKLGTENIATYGDGTIAPSTEAISLLNLKDTIDWIFLNNLLRLRTTNGTLTVNVRKTETVPSPTREQDIVITTGIVTTPTTIKWLRAGNYVIALDKQITVPVGQSFQMVLKEVVDCKQAWEYP